jgi:glycine hydroxymethyltransferase
MAAKAVAFELASRDDFRVYAAAVAQNAQALAEALTQCGLTVVSGGTDNHLLLVDVRPLGLTGRQAEAALAACGVTVNRNVVPGESNGAWYTSGLRLGTPALTTRGLSADEMRTVAQLIADVLRATTPARTAAGAPSLAKFELDDRTQREVRSAVRELLQPHPLYPSVQLS